MVKYCITIFYLLIGFIQFVNAQTESGRKKTPEVTNLKYQRLGDSLITTFDLQDYDDSKCYIVSVIIIDSSFRKHEITESTGDINNPITGGINKSFTLSFTKYNFKIGIYKIECKVSKYSFGGGPSNALLSLAVPGLGDQFVYKNKLRGLLITTATVSCFILGMQEFAKAKDFYNEYNSYNDYNPANQPIRNNAYEQANKHVGKGNVFMMTGAAIWALDIGLVYFKGKKNKLSKDKLTQKSTTSFMNNVDVHLGSSKWNGTNFFALNLKYKF